ncbi:TadE family protein [Ideonella sp. DXS29W]|uniref:TadE family protein n=1 Tax=Ideonella lacteola TaxID=2984193 RepID=A0ABU9BQA4_9BURK
MNRKNFRRQRGVSMVEFVIVFPVAALFVLTLIQVGFIYMAKSTLNNATFMAARAGALNNANMTVITDALKRGLIPFYQDSSITNDVQRMTLAYMNPNPLRNSVLTDAFGPKPWRTQVTLLSPSSDTFADYGVRDNVKRVTYIPNDNLQYRRQDITGAGTSIAGSRSKVNIRDANLLKLKVVYGYELKVPLVGYVLRSVMCGSGGTGAAAWGDTNIIESIEHGSISYCKYMPTNDSVHIPIESYAIVEMQSRAERP